MEFRRSVVFMVATLLYLRTILQEAEILQPAGMAREKSRRGIRRSYFAEKSELLHHGYEVLHGFLDKSNISTEVLNVLE